MGRAGKPTAGGRMGMAERNETLPTNASLVALIFVTVKTIICLRSDTIMRCVILATLAKGNLAPCCVTFDSLILVAEALRL